MQPNNCADIANHTPNGIHDSNANYSIPAPEVSPTLMPTAQQYVGINFGPPFFDWKKYDADLRAVRRIALGTNAIYSLNWFLGFCSLTWATTVILGGVVTGLKKRDYCYVAILLLLEAVRLACARFFCFSVRQHLINCSPEPTSQLAYNDYRNLVVAELLRTVGHFIALFFVSVSIVIPIRSLRDINYPVDPSLQPAYSYNFHSLETSLRVFYTITLVNAFIAAFGVFYGRIVVYFRIRPWLHSLHKYYDKIVWNGVDKGLFNSAVFDILQFAFQVQAEEYMHNKRAATVMYIYEYLILYLYEHPFRKGFEAAKVALEADDIYVREAAANIVGCWVKLRTGEQKGIEELLLQEKLLSKLASAIEHEETGRAATYSFEALAMICPKETAMVRNEAGEKLANILMKRIHEAVNHRIYDKALVFIKALIHLLPCVLQEYCSSSSSSGSPSSSNDLQMDNKSQLALIISLVNQVEMELRKNCTKAEDLLEALRSLLISRQVSDQFIQPQPQVSGKIKTLHDDLISILFNSESKRAKAVAAKALDLIWKNPDLETLRDQMNLSTDEIIQALMEPLPERSAEQSRGGINSIFSRSIKFLSSIILELLVGPDPSASARGGAYDEYIFEDEWRYLKEVIDGLRGNPTADDTKDRPILPLEPDRIRLQLRTIYTHYNLPRWIENIKVTSCAIAATMLILMVGGVVYFTKDFHT